MQLRDSGKTILFCSYSMFQVESLCSRVIWLDHGKMIADGDAAKVVADYQIFLDKSALARNGEAASATSSLPIETPQSTESSQFAAGHAHLEKVSILVDGKNCKDAPVISGQSSLSVRITFASDPALPCPNVAVTIHSMDARTITSAATWEDRITPVRQPDGSGSICLTFDQLPLLKGEYLISAHLLCERGIHVYESAIGIATLTVHQKGRLQGYFAMPHRWQSDIGHAQNESGQTQS